MEAARESSLQRFCKNDCCDRSAGCLGQAAGFRFQGFMFHPRRLPGQASPLQELCLLVFPPKCKMSPLVLEAQGLAARGPQGTWRGSSPAPQATHRSVSDTCLLGASPRGAEDARNPDNQTLTQELNSKGSSSPANNDFTFLGINY